MEALQTFVAEFLRPLSASLIATAIFGGLFFGRIYNRILDVPPKMVYHKLVAGVGFIFLAFIFRLVSSFISTGAAVGSFVGWLAIMALWALYCLFIWIGQNKIP